MSTNKTNFILSLYCAWYGICINGKKCNCFPVGCVQFQNVDRITERKIYVKEIRYFKVIAVSCRMQIVR